MYCLLELLPGLDSSGPRIWGDVGCIVYYSYSQVWVQVVPGFGGYLRERLGGSQTKSPDSICIVRDKATVESVSIDTSRGQQETYRAVIVVVVSLIS